MQNETHNHPTPKPLNEIKAHLDKMVQGYVSRPEKPSTEEEAIIEDALANFKAAGVQLLTDAAPHLWQFYQYILKANSADIIADYGIPTDLTPDDIWSYVVVKNSVTIGMGGENKRVPSQSYILFDADFVWEEEHGLQLVFEYGPKLCRVSHYDGWFTNAYAMSDESLIGTVVLPLRY